MSWDIVLFSYKEPITSIPDIDEDKLVPVNFDEALLGNFPSAKTYKGHVSIEGDGFSIEFFLDGVLASNKMISLYGEKALYELIPLAVENNWQIYDGGIDAMIDLGNPAANGYSNFRDYVRQVIRQPENDTSLPSNKPIAGKTTISKIAALVSRIFAVRRKSSSNN